MKRNLEWLIAGMLSVSPIVGCDGVTSGRCVIDSSYKPAIDPADFVEGVDHPLFPLVRGTKMVLQGGNERIEIVVREKFKMIQGVACTVVRDAAIVDGEVIEDTEDWFAQDKDGTVWYFGEDTKEFENGQVVARKGSWEAGVDGAQPGIVMLADPNVGDSYRQEYYACEAEDKADVLAIDEAVSVPLGDFDHCIKTRDYTPLEPDLKEEKYYCPGVGNALTVDVTTGDRTELAAITPPSPED